LPVEFPRKRITVENAEYGKLLIVGDIALFFDQIRGRLYADKPHLPWLFMRKRADKEIAE
jgi:hypothetical protein